MNKSLISIITPSLNQGKFIEQNILSVLNQKYNKCEHIIVDGGSDDNTIEILRKYEKKYDLKWISEPDNGQSSAINKGIRMSKGDIMAWLNADDYYSSNAFEKIANEFNENTNVDIIYGDCNYVDEKGIFLGVYPTRDFNLQELVNNIPMHITCQSAFFKRKIFNQIGLFDENLHYTMDLEIIIRAGKANFKFKYINKDVANFRKHSKAKTGNTEARIKQFKEVLNISRKYGGNYFNDIRHKYYRFRLSLVKSKVLSYIKL